MKLSVIQLLVLVVLYGVAAAQAKTHHYDFEIKEANYTRLCETKSILTVNGQFPGPTISARRGDFVFVKVRNHAENNITLHWHGIDQPRNPWSDGPEYITQCPIQHGGEMTYRIEITEEEGTVWWHAHSDWDRATVHGALIIHPKKGEFFPFPKPHKEVPIILGEWWKENVSEVIADALRTGGDPNISDAYTINGQPGDLYACSKPDTFKLQVEHGKTYLLRMINAAINNELFFAVAGHKLTVVGTDASYTKPLTVDYVMITPGQTMDVLLKTDASPSQRYYMAAKSYSSAVGVDFDETTTTAIVEYVASHNAGGRKSNLPAPPPASLNTTPAFPSLPAYNDTDAATEFTAGLRSLASLEHPIDVPQTIDERIIMAVSVNIEPCGNTTNGPCLGPFGERLSASLNNISFATPTISVLQAYNNNISGVYGEDFPNEPPFKYNYTADSFPRSFLYDRREREVKVLEYNKSIELVFQGTNLLAGENHPMHLHGQSFYVVGRGFGNYDKTKDPESYNLVDPPFENTVGVPKNGWAAVRFRTMNPGVWFLHCHLDRHTSWGMTMVFIVKNGPTPQSSMLPPPPDMPVC